MRKLRAAQASPENSPKTVNNLIPPSAALVPAEPVNIATVVEEQSSAEEGEIEEDSNVPMTETVPYPMHDQNLQLNNKRKHGQYDHNNHTGKKASKKARKKRKHAQKGS